MSRKLFDKVLEFLRMSSQPDRIGLVFLEIYDKQNADVLQARPGQVQKQKQ